jgi:hypothetical protein
VSGFPSMTRLLASELTGGEKKSIQLLADEAEAA